ncbi:MAG: hypothetical protein QOH63_2299 [Acidobacteriota bacterium]|jgi:hypothetical protein|nr:hypothetical protein [Acidobacteriota bacterium]
MSNIKRLVIILFISALGASAQVVGREPNQNWQPSRTWVVAVGILEWQHSDSWDSFPQAGRKDVELVEFFKRAGVPQNQILFLKDREATKERIQRSMTRLLARAQEGDMLIFYFTGHGAQDEAGATYFANYDADDDFAQTAWSVRSIFDTIERNFKGSRVLLTADCCYSGALANEAARRRTSISYAVLTSSRYNSLSTANWTFTEALLSGFRGNAKVDQNLDGEIELSELAHYARARMWSVEEQRTAFTTTKDFSPEMGLVEVWKRANSRINERVEVLWEDDWYPATILEVRGSKYKIHYLGYDTEWDEWVDAARLRRMRPTITPASGKNVYLNFSPTITSLN